MDKNSSWRCGLVVAFITAIQLSPAGFLFAQQTGNNKQPVPLVAKVLTVKGALLEMEKHKWVPVKVGEKIRAGRELVSFPDTELHSANGAIELIMISDIGKKGVHPILETAVVLKKNAAVDLDVTFRRGLLVLTNVKKSGPAKVRLRFRHAVWDLTLKEPGTKVVAEFYSRLVPGLPSIADWKKKKPAAHLSLLVIKGKAFLHTEEAGLGLSAPPGHALLVWDTLDSQPEVERLEKLPELVEPANKKETALMDQIEKAASRLMSKDSGTVVDDLMKSNKRADRLVAVTMMGVLDDLPRLIAALSNRQHKEVRDHAVLTLRHWLGREPGQAKKLYAALVKDRKYSRVHALTIIQLLFGFNHEQAADPRIYQVLIHYLGHSQMAVRELAEWNLVRLAPAGRDIAYNPAAPPAQRQQTMQNWRRLIPAGQLPPRPKSLNIK